MKMREIHMKIDEGKNVWMNQQQKNFKNKKNCYPSKCVYVMNCMYRNIYVKHFVGGFITFLFVHGFFLCMFTYQEMLRNQQK